MLDHHSPLDPQKQGIISRPSFHPSRCADTCRQATELSWKCDYIGAAVEALWKHLLYYYNGDTQSSYAHFLTIVQSSGMGKSRVLDELSKIQFIIPINLRRPHTYGTPRPLEIQICITDCFTLSGYPPADEELRDFLLESKSPDEAYRLLHYFVVALFETSAQVVRGLRGLDSVSYEVLAARFRKHMTEGQTMRGAGEHRRQFYELVIERTRKVGLQPNAVCFYFLNLLSSC